jgi:hypothetical protein
MASIINTAAQRINADTAGLTYLPEAPGTTPGSPAGLVPSELASAVRTGVADGSLGWLSGGLHPESLVNDLLPQNSAEVVPTDSKPGRTGGLVPRGTGTLAPGPAGAVAAARSTLAKIRASLRI